MTNQTRAKVNRLVLEIEEAKREALSKEDSTCPEHRYRWFSGNETSQDISHADFITVDEAVIGIHAFLQDYCTGVYDETPRRVGVCWRDNFRKFSIVNEPNLQNGDSHSWNISFSIGRYFKVALEHGLDDWEPLVKRVRRIAEHLECDGKKIDASLSLVELAELELMRHLNGLKYYYTFHAEFDAEQAKVDYELDSYISAEDAGLAYHAIWNFDWNDLAWKLRLEPVSQHPSKHEYLYFEVYT